MPEPLQGGLRLRLGEGTADVAAFCPTVHAPGSFHGPTGRWMQVRVRWPRCEPRRPVALRARFAFDAPPCTRLAGRLRLGARRFRIVADRVPACGNGVRDAGEQCDGPDVRYGDCCDAGCHARPDCPVRCDGFFPCADGEVCVAFCRSGGVCEVRADIDCGATPVCGCDLTTTYPNRCAAIDAGAAVAHTGACLAP